MARYVGKRIVPKHCGYWDNTKSYEMENIVYDRTSGNSYISRKAVPVGTDISQEEYWALYCKNMVAKLRKKREEREKLEAAQEQRRKEFTADMARLGLSVEDIVTTDEYGFPIVRTALVAGTDTVLGYWEQKK